MATPAIIKKLLFKYIREAPKSEIADYLEIMFNALSGTQKLALIAAAKAYLLPKVQNDLNTANDSFYFVSTNTTTVLCNMTDTVSEAQQLVDEVESL